VSSTGSPDLRPTTAGSLPSSSPQMAAVRQVHIKLHNADGAVYGVGMPVIAYFSGMIAESKTLSAATSITVNGKPCHGAWYFERSSALPGYPLEGHLRMSTYWPAHAKIHVGLDTGGRSAGQGRTFDDSLTLDFSTGAQTIAVVDDKTHRMTVTSDGKKVGTFPVSLGSASTPTMSGTKVIMAKGDPICMSGPGYDSCDIRYTQRLSYDGEYLHAAPWNLENIKAGIDSSHGTTNLLPDDAKRLFGVLEVGDIVRYPNASGPLMPVSAGLGDWNVPWKVWLLGGAIPTR
jgi:lipoprotein-anchoring transpeptidase ErfK/SrfK